MLIRVGLIVGVSAGVAAMTLLLLLLTLHARVRRGLAEQGRAGWRALDTLRLLWKPLLSIAGGGGVLSGVALTVLPGVMHGIPGIWLPALSLGLVALGALALVVIVAQTRIVDARQAPREQQAKGDSTV